MSGAAFLAIVMVALLAIGGVAASVMRPSPVPLPRGSVVLPPHLEQRSQSRPPRLQAGGVYPVTFIEEGLPAGVLWAINLSGVVNFSTTRSIGFSEPNGTYYFQPSSTLVSCYAIGGNGSVTVNGTTVSRTVPFYCALVTNVGAGNRTGGSAFDPANGNMYVAELGWGSANVTVLNGTSAQIVASIPMSKVLPAATTYNGNQTAVLYDPVNNLVYVDGVFSYNVSVINPNTETVVGSIGPLSPGCGYACATGASMALDLVSNTIFVSEAGNPVVAVIDANTSQMLPALTAGTVPGGALAFDASNEYLYMPGTVGGSGCPGSVCVAAVNPTVDTVVALIPTVASTADAITDIAYDAANRNLYVAESPNPGASPPGIPTATMAVINGTSNRLLTLLQPGGAGFSGGPNRVIAVDVADDYVMATTANLSVSPGVLNLTIIDGRQDRVIRSYPLEALGNPFGVSFDSSAGYAYVSDGGCDGNMSYCSKPYEGEAVAAFPLAELLSAGIMAAQLSVVAGGNLSLSAEASCIPISCLSGGAYVWDLSNASLGRFISNTGPSITFVAGRALGIETISLNVTQGAVTVQSLSLNVTIVPPTGPSLSLNVTHLADDVGETLTIRSVVSGGTAPFAFNYTPSSSALGCAPSVSSELNCTPTQVGTGFNVSAVVKDFYGLASPALVSNLSVAPAMHLNLSVSNATPLLGQTVAITGNVSGGAPPYTYSYSGLPFGCHAENKSSIGCLPTQADFYNITINVTDRNLAVVSATAPMRVIFDFNVIVPASTPLGKQLTILVNTNETFNNSAINKSTLLVPAAGYGAFTYSYTGLPPGCVSEDVATLTCTPTQTGLYSVNVSVRDQAGDRQSHTVAVVIVPARSPAPGPIPWLSGTTGYLTVGGVAAVVAFAGALVFLRRRRPRLPRDQDYAETAEGRGTAPPP